MKKKVVAAMMSVALVAAVGIGGTDRKSVV